MSNTERTAIVTVTHEVRFEDNGVDSLNDQAIQAYHDHDDGELLDIVSVKITPLEK